MNKIINTEEQFKNIGYLCNHYKPKIYLSQYLFSKEILLDIFCTDYLVFCYEDYYYNDISISMIKEYQSHIDIDEFCQLWNDLDIIRTIELRSELILQIFESKKNINNISEWYFELIDDYIKTLSKKNHNDIIIDYFNELENNKFVIKYNLYDKKENIKSITNIIDKAKQILNSIPKKYSSILPL